MEQDSTRLGRQSSSTEVAAIELGVRLARPPAKVAHDASFLNENPLRLRGQESSESSLQGESSSSEQKSKVSKFMNATRSIIQEKKKRRRSAASSSQNESVIKTTFETDCVLMERERYKQLEKTFGVSTSILVTIAASAALQVRFLVTKTSSCDAETSQSTALLFFVLLAVCSEICDVIVQVSMPSSSFLPGTRRALNLVAIALFLLVTIPIDDTKPADGTCATFTYSADTGSCKHFDTSTMNDFEDAMRVCKSAYIAHIHQ